MASSGDLREDVARAIRREDRLVNDARQLERMADAAVDTVRAHDAAHPEPWLIDDAIATHRYCCLSIFNTPRAKPHDDRCLAIPEPVRAAAGLT